MKQELVQTEMLVEFNPKTSFTIICKGLLVSIEFDAIPHISKYGNQTVIYTSDSCYKTCSSLQEILHDLPVNEFFRVHRSHIVSLKHVTGIKKIKMKVADNWLPMSAYYKRQIVKSLGRVLNSWYESFLLLQ